MQDGSDVVAEAGARLVPGWPGGAVHPADDADVAVLLLDTRRGLVTYANPAALALTGARAHLPVDAPAWTAAARLVLPGQDQADEEQLALPVVDPVSVVAAGGVVLGMRLEVTDDEGRQRPYWVTGSQLLSASGIPGTRAIVALFPVHAPHTERGEASSRTPKLPGPTPGIPPDAPGGFDDLTARALVASSVSFTISDPTLPDNPLVWVNPAFERMTGYQASEIIGRNCRLLQGAGTDRAAVRRVHEALERGEAVRAELLNYRKDGTPFWNSFTISPVVDGDLRITHFVGVQTDITARVIAGMEYERLLSAEREARAVAEHAKERLDVMVDVGAVLTQTLDADEAMRRLAETVVPRFADVCIVDLLDAADESGVGVQGGRVPQPAPDRMAYARALVRAGRRVAVAHRDPEFAAALAARPPDPGGERGMGLVVRALLAAEPVHLADIDEADTVAWAAGDPALLALARALRTRTVVVAPLRARGRVLGALTLGQTAASGRRFDEADLGLARTLAARAALAVDNALLFEAESIQRRRADALAAAGTALAASGLRSTDAVTVLLDHVVPALAEWAFVHADERASPALRGGDTAPGLSPVASRHAEPAQSDEMQALMHRCAITAGSPGPGQAWASGTPQLVAVDDELFRSPELTSGQREGLRPLLGGCLASVPLTVRGSTFGALTVVRRHGPAFTGDEVRYLAELGRRAALTLDNARLYESERLVALELQRSLLPARLPRLAQLDVAGRYLAGAAGSEVGGDWYDVIPLPGGRVAVAVGDVMGRGVHAAAVMGQLRAALRSYAVERLRPREVLEHLAAFTEVLEGDHLVTCLVGVHDAVAGTVTFASAGHLPPLRLGAGGEVGYVDVRPGLPLGVPPALEAAPATGRGAPYPESTVPLPAGSTLLMFTDGLVEDRDVPVGGGMQRLAEAFVGRLPATAQEACSAALRAMGRDTSHDDDTAVLALRATDLTPGADPGFGLHGAAEPTSVTRVELVSSPRAPAVARRAVSAALDEAGLTGHLDTAALLVSEVVTNALRHGGGPEELVVEIDPGGVSVGVRDSSPQPPREEASQGPGAVQVVPGGLAENGRGLLLVDMLADSWGWRPEAGGKLVWFRLLR
ncbi:MAG: SpoIIE family protein phosphatase [Kineosporiaceae bacterium]